MLILVRVPVVEVMVMMVMEKNMMRGGMAQMMTPSVIWTRS